MVVAFAGSGSNIKGRIRWKQWFTGGLVGRRSKRVGCRPVVGDIRVEVAADMAPRVRVCYNIYEGN